MERDLKSVECAQPGCTARTTTCPETHGSTAGHTSMQAYCLRAQGWRKARSSSYYYCTQHGWGPDDSREEYTHATCWRRHFHGEPPPPRQGAAAAAEPPPPRQGAAAAAEEPPPPPPDAAPPAGPSVQPPPPPPRPLVQCSEGHCKIGRGTCPSCSTRRIDWDFNEPLTPLAQQVVELTNALNCLPGWNLPECIVNPRGADLPLAARHDPEAGQGDDREADATNRAGSALMLAALLPHVYGVPRAGPLRVCGWPPPDVLTNISDVVLPRSSQGPDNRRMNVWEALLNHWQDDTDMQWHRDLLYDTLIKFNTAIELVVDRDRVLRVWCLPRRSLQAHVSPGLGMRVRGMHGVLI